MLKRLIALFFLCCLYTLNAQNNIDTASFNSAVKELNFSNNHIVVIGEAHTVRGTHETELFIIDRLAQKGYKTIYIEGGEAEACIINMYFQTGDTTVLIHTRARESTGEYKHYLKLLYALNKKEQYNFVFRGFDFENPVCFSYVFSKWFDTTHIENNSLKQQITLLLSIRSTISYLDHKRMKKVNCIFKSIRDSLPKYETYYRGILKENYAVFKNIITNPVIANFGTRDKNMAVLASTRLKENELDHAIFIAGNHHVYYSRKNFIPLFSTQLPKEYSIIAFPFLYDHCRFYKANTIYSSRKKFLNQFGLDKKDLKETSIEFKNNKHLIPSFNTHMSTIISALYNQ